MATLKLTKAQRAEIDYAIRHLERAQRYLDSPDTFIARRTSSVASNVYTTDTGDRVYSATKGCGSDYVALASGIQALRAFLAPRMAEIDA